MSNYLITILVNFIFYISIPIVIRYVILRRPIKSKWIAIGILLPIFIGFSILINIQRDEGQKKIYQELNMPYKSRLHMIDSPILYVAMALSYSILHRRNKISETIKNESVQIMAETLSKQLVCPNCIAKILIKSAYCNKCGSKIAKTYDSEKKLTIASTRTNNCAALHCQPVMRSVGSGRRRHDGWNTGC